MDSRRTALVKIAAAAGSAALTPLLANSPAIGHMHELADQMPAPPVTVPEYFSQDDWDSISKIADLLIPRTDTPGAVDAGVPHQIDRRVAASPELQEVFKQGLASLAQQVQALNAASFSALSESQQTAILKTMASGTDSVQGAFFKTMKDFTIDAYYSSEAGLVQELGYHGNTFRASFPGCTHPEHWPTEERHP